MKIKDLISIIENLNIKEALEYLVENAQKSGKKTFVVTINPEIIMLAKASVEYEKILRSADLALPDGIGVVWAGKMFGKSFRGRVHGVDLVDRLCKEIANQPITVGFLGGQENVAQSASERLTRKYPGLRVTFAVEEWPKKLDDRKLKIEDRTLKVEKGRSIHPQSSIIENPPPIIYHQSSKDKMSADILFVAFGSPKQEIWIYENLPKINVHLAIGVGGAFDFISGRVPRAQIWVRNLGLEWLFRLLIQPWRIKRQTALIKFISVVLKERFL